MKNFAQIDENNIVVNVIVDVDIVNINTVIVSCDE